MTETSHDLTITRLIAAPRAVIWRAWMEPEHLVKWWCPRPWRTELRGFDPRPGGVFDFVLHGPDGEANPNPGLFLEVVPESRIVFTTALVEGWRPAVPWLAITAIIEMADEGAGTRYTALVLHKDEDDSRRHLEMGFEQGWGTCIEQLGEVARSLA